jgi:hypothetical protein
MTDADKKDLILSYQKKKAAGNFSANLSNPSPGKLRDECLIVYKERYAPEDDIILRLFFEKDKEGEYSESMLKVDIDKFRPLVALLKGRGDPHEKHYRLLAWLMGFEKNGDIVKKEQKKPAKPVTIRKAIAALIVIVLAGGIYWQLTRQCMYWAGDHYQSSSCNIKLGDTAIIAFDEQKARLKKINRPDTISYKAIGRVWYVKIDKGIEYYTADGFHPIDTRRKLHPITKYMIDMHILHKRGINTDVSVLSKK